MDESLMNWKLAEIIDSWDEDDHDPTPDEEAAVSILLLVESNADDLLILSNQYGRADAAAISGFYALNSMRSRGVLSSVQSRFLKKLRLASCRLFDLQPEELERLMNNRYDVFYNLIRNAKNLTSISDEAALLFTYDIKYDRYVDFFPDSPVILTDFMVQSQILMESKAFLQSVFPLIAKIMNKYGTPVSQPSKHPSAPAPRSPKQPATPTPAPQPKPRTQSSIESSVQGCLLHLIGPAILFVIIALICTFCDSGSNKPTVPQETTRQTAQATEPNLIARTKPANGHVFERIGLATLAPFSVSASSGGGIYVVMDPISFIDPENLERYSTIQLRNKVNSSELRFFVRASCTAKLDVPLGRYRVYYATGDTWYGEEHLFGPDTQYYKCDEEFAFTSDDEGYNGWTLTLTAVYNGNLDTDPIDAEDFPK